MSTDNIIFENIDTPKETAIKTTQIFAGSDNLKKELKKLKVDYTKVYRGVKVVYILRGASIGRIEVILK